MGIARYPVECPGCASGIILRLGVGHDLRQPFFYVCPTCRAATRGALLWDRGAGTKVEIAAGRLLDSEKDCKHTVSINPEIPALPTATGMDVPGGSPFLAFVQWLGGEQILRFQSATAQIRHLIDSEWGALTRLTTYYLNRDWVHFDAALGSVLPEKQANDLSPEWKRDHYVHFFYDLFLAPIFTLDPEESYLHMKTAYNQVWSPDRPNFSALTALAKEESQTTRFRNIQRDLFECISRYVNLVGALTPGMLCDLLPEQHQHEVETLRLFRDDYELLRDLYIQSFETVHKALRWVIGASNADVHGNHARCVPIVGMSQASSKKPPANLDQFSALPNALKREWLAALPEWHRRWDRLFDRHLRNDIGHASARHDLPTGMIFRDKKPPLTYTRFVQQTQRIIQPLISTLSAMKIVKIYADM